MSEYQDVCISAIEVLYYNSSKKYLLDVSSHMAGWKGVYAFRVVIIIGVSLMYHNQTYTVQFISLHFHIQYMYALVRVGVWWVLQC